MHLKLSIPQPHYSQIKITPTSHCSTFKKLLSKSPITHHVYRSANKTSSHSSPVLYEQPQARHKEEYSLP